MISFPRRRRFSAFAPAALGVLCAACNTAGSGTIRGVHYQIALEGSYKLFVANDREQVWIRSDDDRPFVLVMLSPRPRDAKTDEPDPCDTQFDDAEGGSEGALLYVRAGDKAELKAFSAPQGQSLSVDRCIPPGGEGLTCVASFNDGELSPDREAIARRACKSLVVR